MWNESDDNNEPCHAVEIQMVDLFIPVVLLVQYASEHFIYLLNSLKSINIWF